jgi:hypothetical protein
MEGLMNGLAGVGYLHSKMLVRLLVASWPNRFMELERQMASSNDDIGPFFLLWWERPITR